MVNTSLVTKDKRADKAKPATLRAYMEAEQITQVQLAARLGISTPFLSMILNQYRKPSVDVALHIEDVTGVSVRAIVTGKAA